VSTIALVIVLGVSKHFQFFLEISRATKKNGKLATLQMGFLCGVFCDETIHDPLQAYKNGSQLFQNHSDIT